MHRCKSYSLDPVDANEGNPVDVNEGDMVHISEGDPVHANEGNPVDVNEGDMVHVSEGDPVDVSEEADELRRDHQHTVIQSVEQCCEECNKLNEEKRRLLVSLNGLQITVETMKSDEKKVPYYTGLPNFNTLLVLLNFVTVSPQTLSESKLTAQGNKYIVTLMDYFSKWPEAEAIKDKSANSVAIFLNKVICRFGAPKVIISDQGREFVNSVCKKLFKLTKVHHKISSAYHPQTNGLIERYNQTLQRSLVKLVNKEQDNWEIFLEGVLFAYQTSVHKSTGVPPFEIMFGRTAILPIETEELCASSSLIEDSDSNDLETAMNKMTDVKKTLYQKAHDNISSAQQRYKRDYDKKHCKGKVRS
ncbi:hypothetical protein EMCRGX_G031986 [Ephydatia muelleri]